MLKKIAKYIILIIIPLSAMVLASYKYSEYLDEQISTAYNSALGRSYGVDEMNKGLALLKHNAAKNDLILLGSSELADSGYIVQNPSNVFPNTDLNADVCLVGRAGVQHLLDAIKVGALSENFKNKKIVLIVSTQWFFGDDIDTSAYKANFSELQFYKLINNKNISDDIKKAVCERTLKLAKNESNLVIPYLYSYLYSKNNFISNIAFGFMKPYYFAREKFLELKDKHQAYNAVKQFKDKPTQEIKKINWEEEEIKAQQTGEKECTNNNFNVYNEYYTTYIEPRMLEIKNSNKNLDLSKSKEFEDYKTMLEIFKQTEVKPYIIFVSTNGYYYDYTGLTQEKRTIFYNKLTELANEYKMDYLDLREHEYEPYFFKDVMHLGWKGWVYVNQKIAKHFS